MGISFAFQTTCTLKNRTILKQWIKLVIENNNKKVGEIAYIFCSDEQLLEINKEFLITLNLSIHLHRFYEFQRYQGLIILRLLFGQHQYQYRFYAHLHTLDYHFCLF